MTAEAFRCATPYHSPAEHPLFRALADIPRNMTSPIDRTWKQYQDHAATDRSEVAANAEQLHSNILGFERLLLAFACQNHLGHAGSDMTGFSNARSLPPSAPNASYLYMEIKTDPQMRQELSTY